MTLLHQAAQKAVEAHYKELGDAWIAFDGSPGTAKRVNFALGMLGFAIDALVAQMSALQQQPEPVALERWGRAKSNGAVSLERMPDGYWTPWHIAQEALAASPYTTRQQEVGSGPVIGSSGSDWIAAGGFRFHEHAGWQQVAAEYANNSDVTTLYRKRCDAPAAPSTPEKAGGVPVVRTYLHASRVDALIAVMEGECDGLAVTRETAEAILHYLDGNAPPVGVAPCSLCASHDLCKQHGCAGKALERERAARGVPAVAPVRLVEGPPRDFGQAQDRYGEHMDRPAPASPSPIPHPLPAQANDGGEHD